MNKIARSVATVVGLIIASSFVLGIVVSFLPTVASGACVATGGIICPPDSGIKTVGDVKDKLLCNALNWLFTAAIILSIICIIWAAISYMKSGGGESVSKASQALTFAIIGIVVAILAKGVPVIISAFINSSSPLTSGQIC